MAKVNNSLDHGLTYKSRHSGGGGGSLSEKKKLIEKYRPLSNCTEIVPLKLNPGFNASLQEPIIKKDAQAMARKERSMYCVFG